MKLPARQLLLLALVSLPLAGRAAAPVIYDTGVDNAFVQLPGGSADPHYTITINSSTVAAVVMSDANLWYQWPRPADARWIYNADLFDSGLRATVVFTTTFDLSGFDPSTAFLSGFWAADQYGSLSLNGNATGVSVADGNWMQLNAFSVSSGFISGTNTLQFTVALPDGGDGLITSGLTLTAQAIPEPGRIGLLAGLAMLAVVIRRRRSVEGSGSVSEHVLH